MENPFPGMDPYMEQRWGDAHHALITYARDQLAPRLPAALLARIGERVFVEFASAGNRDIYPDLRVVEQTTVGNPLGSPATAFAGGGNGGIGGALLAEPLIIRLPHEPKAEGFIEIVDADSGDRVVTVIEVLSPSNKKRGDGQNLYLQKQDECIDARVNLVEIDLLRAGRRVLAISEDRIPPSHRTPYRVCVWRGSKPRQGEVYRVPLRERLPAIRVPLREGDPDVALDLQPLVNQAYRNGGYGRTDYTVEPVPPLELGDAKWADDLLKEKGLRPRA